MTTPPDKISEAIHAASFAMEAATLCGQDHCTVMHRDLERLIQAATTPAAVVTVSEIADLIDSCYVGVKLMSANAIAKKYAGRAIIITADNEKDKA